MFDVSFTELMVVGVVALIVIGPERLPRVARTAGHLLGRLQRYVNAVKSDINREMHMEDLRKFEREVKSQIQSVESSVSTELSAVQSSVDAAISPPSEQSIAPPTQAAVPPAPTFESDAMLPTLNTSPSVSEAAPTGRV